ncbi:hypothetical protein C8J57DRAFT_1533322 [Mycena rebaudengoi]|nr:hypothetical protein C8J57DRAFT_1533322 [Mycena rebaudengoi]
MSSHSPPPSFRHTPGHSSTLRLLVRWHCRAPVSDARRSMAKRNDNAAELAPENRRRVLSMLITRWRRLRCLTMSAAVVAAAPFSLSSSLSFVSGRWDRTVRIWEEGRGHAPEVYHTKRMGPSPHSFLSLLSTLHSSSSSSFARSAPHSLPSFVFFPVLVVRAPLPPALLLVFRASALPSVSQLSLSFVVDTVSAALFTSDARFILSGFDDGNVRLWKADASARLGVVAAIEYGATLKERWKVDKEVAPRPAVHQASSLKRTMLDAQRVKEERCRKHTCAGAEKPRAERKKLVVVEQA